MLALPYLVSLHASAVTCATYLSDLPPHTWHNIVARRRSCLIFCFQEWPINGGLCDEDLNDEEEVEGGGEGGGGEEVRRDILLTGHEDGSVRFWRAGSVALSPLYTFASKQAMHAQDDDDALLVEHPVDDAAAAATADNGDVDDDDDDWPFRKVGSFDPYSDDPRLAVKKVLLCAKSGILAVAGTAGHVIIAKLSLESATRALKAVTVNLVNDRDAFVWKGHSRLTVKGGGGGGGGGEGGGMLQMDAGFQPQSVVQLHPPAAVTALALAAQPLSLVAVGTAHGLAVYDFVRHAAVAHKCTLNPNDLSGAGDVPISRRKSFKKSLRESFRRLRKGRSTRRPEKQRNVSTQQSPSTPESRKIVDSSPTSPIEAKPVERAIESRPVDDSLGSMVRCLAFANTYIVTVQNTMPTLWAGTNNGTVYVFTIATARDSDKKKDAPIGCQLGKEIQLKHRAPVIGINVIDSLCYPVDPVAKHGLNPPHRVIISSEEQIKIFTLPQLKPFNKLKLTAAEGARVRRTALAEFRVSLDHASGHDQVCLLCLTNLGDTIVLSLPDLRRQINAAVIRKEDINGISSLAFTSYGEGVYLHSSSELQRVTVSATRVTLPHCRLQLPKEARPHSQSAADDESSSDDDDSSSSASSSSSSSSSSSKSSVASQQQNKDMASKPSSEQQQPKQDGGEQQVVTSAAEKAAVVVNGVGETNGEAGEGEGEGEQDVTALSLSVGDITIDSVKDHLVNSSMLSTEESGGGSTRVISSTVTTTTTTVANSGGEVTTTTATNNKQETTVSSSQQQETAAVAAVIKRTTTVVTTNNTTNNQTTTAPPQPPHNNESEAPQLDSAHLLDEIRKAPLAKMEDLEMELAA
ncbi:hypothetical protein LSTR_LSTR013142 [Laodelphax striatellus]|uniref:Lethal giant larvae homologue 2 domain-containing protein n=1 Tax=Laodelphax striatellus TaxID=195883 RepID=A0A482XQK3_LAOST|nr:hypothetical protein LSTR_LSTR013142 [Laodelphax striatellus]